MNLRISEAALLMFFGLDILNMWSKFTEEHLRRNALHFIETALRHGCSPVNLVHIFRIPFYKNTSGVLLLININ